MTYDSPLWTSEGLVIPEVASFLRRKVWWSQKHEKEKKKIWKIVAPTLISWWNGRVLTTTTPLRHCCNRLKQSVLWNKSSHFTHPDWDDRYWALELTYYHRTLLHTLHCTALHWWVINWYWLNEKKQGNMLHPETLGETYVLSFSWNGTDDLGRAASWAAHIVLPDFSILCPDSQIMIFQYSILAIWQLKVQALGMISKRNLNFF